MIISITGILYNKDETILEQVRGVIATIPGGKLESGTGRF